MAKRNRPILHEDRDARQRDAEDTNRLEERRRSIKALIQLLELVRRLYGKSELTHVLALGSWRDARGVVTLTLEEGVFHLRSDESLPRKPGLKRDAILQSSEVVHLARERPNLSVDSIDEELQLLWAQLKGEFDRVAPIVAPDVMAPELSSEVGSVAQ